MFFDKTKDYVLPFSKRYVQQWGVVEAVRELIQNAIDSESPFEYEFNGGQLIITSRYSELSVSSLLLGNTTKDQDDTAIGNFGEGYKIAMLVLTREGKNVTILNGDKVWTPKFKHIPQYGDEVLCIEETKGNAQGLSFIIENLSQNDISMIKGSCIQMQHPEDIGEVESTKYGDILLDRSGELFVGGLFICKTNLSYSYNVKPQYISLERDRQTVSDFDLLFVTKDMWLCTTDYDRIAELMKQECHDLKYVSWGAPELVKEACYRKFTSEYGEGSIVVKSQQELDDLTKKGVVKTIIVNSGFSEMLSTYEPYRESYTRSVKPDDKPVDILVKWLSANRKNMRGAAIESFRKELINNASLWKIK